MCRQFYLIVFINHIFLLCVTSKPKPMDSQESSQFLPMPNSHYRNFAQSVCTNMDISTSLISKCKKNFLDSEPNTLTPPTIDVKCPMKESVRFEIKPSRNWQVVVLLPDNFTDVDVDDINFIVIEPGTTFSQISTGLRTNCTIWSAILDDNWSPSTWLEGPIVTPLNETLIAMKTRDYDVTIKYDGYKSDNGGTVAALFTWTSIDEDLCFDVMNYCGNKYKEASFWSTNPHFLLDDLQLDHICDIHIVSLYGKANIQYHTPSCAEFEDCIPVGKQEPEIPQDILLHADESTDGASWNLKVLWRRPTITPEHYNVTVRTNANRTVVRVPGNDTSVVIQNVIGEGYYNVTVAATIGRNSSVNSSRGMFPDPGGWWWGGAWAGGVAAAGLALLAALLWRHARPARAAPDYEPEDSEDQKGVMEGIGLEPRVEDSWEVRSDRLLLHEVIGEGAFGVVRRGTLAPGEKQVAVKMLRDFPTLDEIRSFYAEMELMKTVGAHAHLVSLVGCCSGRKPFIIAEYCNKGDLLSFLRQSWDVMVAKRNAKYHHNNNVDTPEYENDLYKCKIQSEHSKLVVNKLYDIQRIYDLELTSLDLLSFCRQIVMGMEFLASNRVVHRDLAARNILVTGDNTLKIADFGLSRDIYEENQYRQKGNGKMPVKWMAIESLARRIYTSQSDVWSFGIVMWEIATVGGSPYPEVPAARLPRLLRAGYRMPRPNNCSKPLYDLMHSCWRAQPRDRPTFSELHEKLDELLNIACADDYLCLELETEELPTPKTYKYLKMIIRGKRSNTRGEIYERPLKSAYSNRYTTLPVTLSKTQPV